MGSNLFPSQAFFLHSSLYRNILRSQVNCCLPILIQTATYQIIFWNCLKIQKSYILGFLSRTLPWQIPQCRINCKQPSLAFQRLERISKYLKKLSFALWCIFLLLVEIWSRLSRNRLVMATLMSGWNISATKWDGRRVRSVIKRPGLEKQLWLSCTLTQHAVQWLILSCSALSYCTVLQLCWRIKVSLWGKTNIFQHAAHVRIELWLLWPT